MADIFTKKKRSEVMGAVSGKETKPEILVRKYLFKEGFRFRKNLKTLPGSPDIVLAKYRTVIFVHGCFWHGHRDCRKATIPKTNTEFWRSKINTNIERDSRVITELKKSRWRVITIWGCKLTKSNELDKTMNKVTSMLHRYYVKK